MLSTQRLFGFDPRTIPGCQLWLDAADPFSFTLSGSSLSTWRDKSGTNKTVTINSAPTYSSTAFNNRQGFTFATGNRVSITLPTALGRIMTLVAVYRVTTTSTSTIVAVGLSNSATETGIGWNGTGYYNMYDFGVAESRNTVYTTSNRDNVHIGTKGSTLGAYIHGFNPTSFPSTTYNNTNLTINIGGGGFPFIGSLAEVIVYSTEVTLSERRQLEGYLVWKWGLQTNVAISHPFRSNPTTMRIFQPTDVDGLQLWLDSADNSTIALSGSSVTQWNDKSGNNRNATAVTAPTYNATNRSIRFTDTSNQLLSLPSGSIPSGNSSYSIFILWRPLTNTAINGLLYSGASAAVVNQVLGVYMSTSRQMNVTWHNNDLGTTLSLIHI